MPTAVYPGSLDPVTYGHVAAIADAAEAFGDVVVALGANPGKSYLFSVAEREALTRMAVSHLKGVRVTSFSGLLVHYLVRNNLSVVVRGLRNGQDLSDAMVQDTIGWQQALAKDIKVFYVPARAGQQFTSSSALKRVLKEQGYANPMAPLSTIHATQARLLGQYVYGITGTSGAGKSFICRAFAAIAAKLDIELVHIDLDRLAHEILSDAEEPLYRKARAEVGNVFGDEVVNEDGSINRKALGQIVFGEPAKLAQLNELLHEPIFFRLHDQMRDRAGLFLVDAALLAESGRTHLAHNNVLLMDAPVEARTERLEARDGLLPEQIERRIYSQYSAEVKESAVQAAIADARYGQLDRLMNDDALAEQEIEAAFDRMLERVDVYGELRIRSFLKRLGVEDTVAAYRDIRAMYSGNDRLYHSLAHIVDGLNKLTGFRDMLDAPEAFVLAWLFHDAVYDARRKDNEEQSAQLMATSAGRWGIDAGIIKTAERLVRVTQHGIAVAETLDERFIVDLDMSILGASGDVFAQYEHDVRREYGFMGQAEWNKGRADFLKGLKAPYFLTEFFRGGYEMQAGLNIAEGIRRASGK